MRLPVALELLALLATVNIPQPDRLVTRPTDELRWIRRVELDGKDPIVDIVSNVTFTGNFSPPVTWLNTNANVSPVALQAQTFRSCLCADEMDAPSFVPSRDDVACGPILHDKNPRVKVRRVHPLAPW
jgi:hypothetical protein